MKKKTGKTIVVRVERCLGCKSCEIACAVEHSSAKNLEDAVRTREKPGYRVHVEACGPRSVPVHCNHCQDAPCVMACPTGAVYRDTEDGPVLFDRERCIGCRMCVQACPFGVIAVGPEGKGVLKCDLCVERLAAGREPACVEACPTNALCFCEEDEVVVDKRKRTAEKMVLAQQETGAE